jgi:hypothetical protein
MVFARLGARFTQVEVPKRAPHSIWPPRTISAGSRPGPNPAPLVGAPVVNFAALSYPNPGRSPDLGLESSPDYGLGTGVESGLRTLDSGVRTASHQALRVLQGR